MITTLVNEVIRKEIYAVGCEKCREVLFEMWSTIGAKEIWPEIGRFQGFQESKILQHEVHGYTQDKISCDKRFMPEPGEENKYGFVRRLWFERKSSEASSGLLKAKISESSLSDLSCECTSCRWIMGEIREAGGIEDMSNMQEGYGSRERGRSAGVLPDKDLLKKMWMDTKKAQRIDRLRLLGNGVVPQQAARAWEVLNGK